MVCNNLNRYLELIGEGGFSKIYKATWIDCQISDWGTHIQQIVSKTVALKKLNNSKNITSKELNGAQDVLSLFFELEKCN